jgi:hypothetical protein
MAGDESDSSIPFRVGNENCQPLESGLFFFSAHDPPGCGSLITRRLRRAPAGKSCWLLFVKPDQNGRCFRMVATEPFPEFRDRNEIDNRCIVLN